MQKNARKKVGSRRSGGCPSGKVRWRDHKEAARAISTIRMHAERGSSYGDDSKLRVYECGMCDGWHATSQVDS